MLSRENDYNHIVNDFTKLVKGSGKNLRLQGELQTIEKKWPKPSSIGHGGKGERVRLIRARAKIRPYRAEIG
jgi:hypothetical protein